MTKRMFLTSLAVLALLATASMVMAQPGGRGQGGPGGPGGQGQRGQGGQPGGPGGPGGGMMGGGAMGILMNEEARTSLGVTEAQIEKLRTAGQELFASMPRPQQGQAPDPAQMREQMQKMQAEIRKNLEATLSADQVTKLDVMVFQRNGGLNPPARPAGPGGNAGGLGGPGGFNVMAFNVETLRALNLTEDQKKKIEEAQTKLFEAMPRPPQGGPGAGGTPPTAEERQARLETMQKAVEEFQAATKGILTDAQKAQAEALMKDVPAFLQPRAPGAGGPGNRGNLNFTPGSGVPGQNPNREQQRQRNNNAGGGRSFRDT